MINSVVLVGKVHELPIIKTTSNGNKIATMILELDHPFRNDDGTLSTDLFKVTLWKGIAEECLSICKVGNLIAIKGRLQANVFESESKKTYYNAEIFAEKVSFIDQRMKQSIS